jgi:hypothetical protein
VVKKIAAFLRLLDENAQLSLTNIAVMIILVKVALAPTLNFAEVATLLGVLSGYSFKRFVQRKTDKVQPLDIPAELRAKLSAMRSELDGVKLTLGMVPHENNR